MPADLPDPLLKADTVVCWDPWAHDEENPDHDMIAKALEAACWMAGRDHDYPGAARGRLRAARGAGEVLLSRGGRRSPASWTSASMIDKKVDANRANRAKGPAGHARVAACGPSWRQKDQRLPLLGDDDVTADRNYIKEFVAGARPRAGQAIRRGVRRGIPLHRRRAPRERIGTPEWMLT